MEHKRETGCANTSFFRCSVAAMSLLLISAAALQAGWNDPAEVLPGDVMMMVKVSNVDQMTANFKRTSAHGLYKDPAMQPFVVEAEKKMRALISRKWDSGFKDLGLAAPESLPMPRGAVALALGVIHKTVKQPVYDMEGYDGTGTPEIKEYKEVSVPDIAPVVLADMGENVNAARALAKQLADKQVEKGWTREIRKIHGVAVVILTPPAEEAAFYDGDAEVTSPAIYAFFENTVILSEDAKLLEQVLALMTGASRVGLASRDEYQRLFKTLGEGDLTFYLNASVARKMSLSSETSPARREQTAAKFRALGLTDITSVGVVAQLAPRKGEDMRVKFLLRTDKPEAGLVGALAPESISTAPGSLLTKGTSSFVVANYGLGKLYAQVCKMVQEGFSMDLDSQLKMAMLYMAAMNGEPLDVKKDMIDQITAPITVMARHGDRTQEGEPIGGLVSIAVKDRKTLDKTIGVLHSIFLGKDAQLRRKVGDKTMYLVDLEKVLGSFLPIPPAAGRKRLEGGVLVDDGLLLFGSAAGVQRAVKANRSKDVPSITADPMYAHAAALLPKSAGIWFYRNEQVDSAEAWKNMKAAALEASGRNEDKPKTDEINLEINSGGLIPSIFETLKGHCDFSTLPDFQAVRKYWGASVGHVRRTEQGVYAEIVVVSPPAN